MRWWEMIAQRFRAPDLMERMLAHFGVRTALAERPGGPEALRRATIRCMSCSEAEACETWLGDNEAPDKPPSYCRNADLIARLRRADTLH